MRRFWTRGMGLMAVLSMTACGGPVDDGPETYQSPMEQDVLEARYDCGPCNAGSFRKDTSGPDGGSSLEATSEADGGTRQDVAIQ
jgi:hypothetical protein